MTLNLKARVLAQEDSTWSTCSTCQLKPRYDSPRIRGTCETCEQKPKSESSKVVRILNPTRLRSSCSACQSKYNDELYERVAKLEQDILGAAKKPMQDFEVVFARLNEQESSVRVLYERLQYLESCPKYVEELAALVRELPSSRAIHLALEQLSAWQGLEKGPKELQEMFVRLDTRLLKLEKEHTQSAHYSPIDTEAAFALRAESLRRSILEQMGGGLVSFNDRFTSLESRFSKLAKDNAQSTKDLLSDTEVAFASQVKAIEMRLSEMGSILDAAVTSKKYESTGAAFAWRVEAVESKIDTLTHRLAVVSCESCGGDSKHSSIAEARCAKCKQMQGKVGLHEHEQLKKTVMDRCSEIESKTDRVIDLQRQNAEFLIESMNDRVQDFASKAESLQLSIFELRESKADKQKDGNQPILEDYNGLRLQLIRQDSDLRALVGNIEEICKKEKREREIFSEALRGSIAEQRLENSHLQKSKADKQEQNDIAQRHLTSVAAMDLRVSEIGRILDQVVSREKSASATARTDVETMFVLRVKAVEARCEQIAKGAVGLDEHERLRRTMNDKCSEIDCKISTLSSHRLHDVEKEIQERCTLELRKLVASKEWFPPNCVECVGSTLTEAIKQKCMEEIWSRTSEFISLTDANAKTQRESLNVVAESQRKNFELMAESLRHSISEQCRELWESKASKQDQQALAKALQEGTDSMRENCKELKSQFSKQDTDLRSLVRDIDELRKKDDTAKLVDSVKRICLEEVWSRVTAHTSLSEVNTKTHKESLDLVAESQRRNFELMAESLRHSIVEQCRELRESKADKRDQETLAQTLQQQISKQESDLKVLDAALRRAFNEQYNHLQESKANKQDHDEMVKKHLTDGAAIERRISEMGRMVDIAIERRISEMGRMVDTVVTTRSEAMMDQCGKIESKTDHLSRRLDDSLREAWYQEALQPEATSMLQWSAVRSVEQRGNIQVNHSTGQIALLRQLEFQLMTTRDDPAAASTFTESFRDPVMAEAVCRDLAEIANTFRCPVTIEGHTKGGDSEFWQTLADRRARSVAEAMVRFGANPSLLRTRGLPGRIGKNEARTEVYMDLHGAKTEALTGVDIYAGHVIKRDLSHSGLAIQKAPSIPSIYDPGMAQSWPASPSPPRLVPPSPPQTPSSKTRGRMYHNLSLTG